MMDGLEILRVLDDVAGTGARSQKELLLSRALNGDELFQRVMKWTYDPFTTYGLTPERQSGCGARDLDDAFWGLLGALSARKVTGNAARDAVYNLMFNSNTATAEILWRILSKDLRAGFTANTINKVMPGLVPSFECMLSHKYEPKRIKKWPVAIEPKLDGLRAICLVKNGEAKFYSRAGKEFTALAHLGPKVVEWVEKVRTYLMFQCSAYIGADGVAKPKNPQKAAYLGWLGHEDVSLALEGEVLTGGFAATTGDVRRKSEEASNAEYHVFDVVPYHVMTGAYVSWNESLRARRHFLEHAIHHLPEGSPIKLVPQLQAGSHEDVVAIYEAFRDTSLANYLAGRNLELEAELKKTIGDHPLEGAIVKPLEALYEKKRSYGWLKIKAQETEDLVVVDAFEGEGKYVGKLGGLIVDRKGVQVRVGGGFSDEQRTVFWALYQVDKKFPDLKGEMLGSIIEVEFHEVTPDGSLRHPRFVQFRRDLPNKAAA